MIHKKLKTLFGKANKEIYVVGGAVRDKFLGIDPKDYDYTTNATPDETKEIMKEFSIVDIGGEKFGTIQIDMNGEQVEITTFRKEVYNPDSRKPEVEYGDNILDDLKRRDFTINAIAYNLITGDYVDPFDGIKDIIKMKLRCPDNPNITFNEDPLRMLRAARFISRGFTLPANTEIYKAMKENVDRLDIVSAERITEEFCKIMVAENAVDLDFALLLLLKTGILEKIFPEITPMIDLQQNKWHHKDVWNHTRLVVSKTHNNLILRIGALFHDIGKPPTISNDNGEVHFYRHEEEGEKIWLKISDRLKGMTKDTKNKIAFLIRNHLRPGSICGRYPEKLPSNRSVRRLYFDCNEAGDDMWDLLMDLSKADCTSGKLTLEVMGIKTKLSMPDYVSNQVEYLRTRPKDIIKDEAKLPKLPTGLGIELMKKYDRPAGPWIREIQETLLNMCIDDDLQLRPSIEQCLEVLE